MYAGIDLTKHLQNTNKGSSLHNTPSLLTALLLVAWYSIILLFITQFSLLESPSILTLLI